MTMNNFQCGLTATSMYVEPHTMRGKSSNSGQRLVRIALS